MKNRQRILVVAGGALALLVVIWAISAWHYHRTHESTDNAQVGGHLVPVLAKVGGYVQHVAVSENDHVTEGQLLIQIDEQELKQKLAQAEAELAAAQAAAGTAGSAGQAQAQVTQALKQRAALEAEIAAARANVEKADRDLERLQGLAEKQIVSRQQLDAARAAAESAHGRLLALEAQQAAASANVAGAEAGVKLAQARVKAAEAAVENARLQLAYARVVAPVSGTVARRSVEPGQLLQPGQSILTIVADTGLFVNANFKETQLAHIHPGADATFDVDAYSGCEAKGIVESISAATGSQFALIPPDNATGNFTKVVQRVPVRIRVTEPCGDQRPLRPGLSVVVHVASAR